MNITREELDKLREALPHGYADILEQRTGFSKASIYQTMVGSRYNQEIIDAAIELAKETLAKVETSKEQIANL